ncbi:hypothetical protein [Alicyclobacillus sp. SP_1]|uniref:hypothetical protein n=1 Tax=Alicyclobacillus sp. SP_1 TaxID=2942475 RepID=UPI0035BE9ABC
MNPVLDSLISTYFPHRHPFLLIDKVECIEDGRAVTLKSVTRTEPWFTGHFPDHPVLPGVILLEAMAQTGRSTNRLERVRIGSWTDTCREKCLRIIKQI